MQTQKWLITKQIMLLRPWVGKHFNNIMKNDLFSQEGSPDMYWIVGWVPLDGTNSWHQKALAFTHHGTRSGGGFHSMFWMTHTDVSLWRNRPARSAVNREVGGSSPPRDGGCLFLCTTRSVYCLWTCLSTLRSCLSSRTLRRSVPRCTLTSLDCQTSSSFPLVPPEASELLDLPRPHAILDLRSNSFFLHCATLRLLFFILLKKEKRP